MEPNASTPNFPPHEPRQNHFKHTDEAGIISALTYGSYHANRGYGMSSESYAKMMGWNEETRISYESAYQANLEQERQDNGYRKLMEDLDLIQDEQRNFFNNQIK